MPSQFWGQPLLLDNNPRSAVIRWSVPVVMMTGVITVSIINDVSRASAGYWKTLIPQINKTWRWIDNKRWSTFSPACLIVPVIGSFVLSILNTPVVGIVTLVTLIKNPPLVVVFALILVIAFIMLAGLTITIPHYIRPAVPAYFGGQSAILNKSPWPMVISWTVPAIATVDVIIPI